MSTRRLPGHTPFQKSGIDWPRGSWHFKRPGVSRTGDLTLPCDKGSRASAMLKPLQTFANHASCGGKKKTCLVHVHAARRPSIQTLGLQGDAKRCQAMPRRPLAKRQTGPLEVPGFRRKTKICASAPEAAPWPEQGLDLGLLLFGICLHSRTPRHEMPGKQKECATPKRRTLEKNSPKWENVQAPQKFVGD